MDGGRVEAALAAIRAGGGRVTMARRLVVEELVATDHHLTAEDLARAIGRRAPEIHLSTVYRTLEALEQAHVVDHVHLGHGRATYHLADSRHHHLVCEDCGVVVELPPDALDVLERQVAADHGFRLRAQHFALVGRCRACVERAEEAERGSRATALSGRARSEVDDRFREAVGG